ncbi:MAG TPA: hypothetical protein VKW76_07890 [Candidatus Binatia bacterium]|nr:hypothetical protein [Candidatus Binatia bacterium]
MADRRVRNGDDGRGRGTAALASDTLLAWLGELSRVPRAVAGLLPLASRAEVAELSRRVAELEERLRAPRPPGG